MPYNEFLATRVRNAAITICEFEEKKVFGGTCILINGNMACGVYKDDLVVRVGTANHAEALSHPHTKLFDITGKAMKGWVMVEPEGCASEEDLVKWIQLGVDYARTLPGK